MTHLWTRITAEWAAMGEAGQAVALWGLPLAYAVLSLVGIWWATRHPLAGPEEMTDASHSPTRGGWQNENYEAQIRAEKEQAG